MGLNGTTVVHMNAVRLDDDPTTYTSTAQEITGFNKGRIDLDLQSTSTPTDIKITMWGSDTEAGTYRKLVQDPVNLLWFEDGGTATQIQESYPIENLTNKWIKFKAVATGTTAGAYFDITLSFTPVT